MPQETEPHQNLNQRRGIFCSKNKQKNNQQQQKKSHKQAYTLNCIHETTEKLLKEVHTYLYVCKKNIFKIFSDTWSGNEEQKITINILHKKGK